MRLLLVRSKNESVVALLLLLLLLPVRGTMLATIELHLNTTASQDSPVSALAPPH